MKNCLASMFDWWHESEGLEGKMFHMNVYPHHPLYQIPLPKRKKVFCNAKVIEGLEAPEGSLSVLFRFLSNGILFQSSVIGSSLGP